MAHAASPVRYQEFEPVTTYVEPPMAHPGSMTGAQSVQYASPPQGVYSPLAPVQSYAQAPTYQQMAPQVTSYASPGMVYDVPQTTAITVEFNIPGIGGSSIVSSPGTWLGGGDVQPVATTAITVPQYGGEPVITTSGQRF